MSEAVSVTDDICLLGESPLWSVDEQAIYWVDIQNPTIFRYHPETGEVKKWRVETEIGSFGFAGANTLVAGLRMGFAKYDLADTSYQILHDHEGNGRLNKTRLNDGKVDRAGRFWCGTMEDPGHGPVGKLLRFEDDGGEPKVLADGIRVPNAISWSPDNKTMYFADSFENRIRAYDFDLATGEIENPRTFAEFDGPGHPDGATVDAEGFLWSANIFGGRVNRFDPDGKLERVIELPTPIVTCCAFGGPDLDVLYVTTASMRLSREELAAQPLAGRLFAVDVGVKGLPEPVFGG